MSQPYIGITGFMSSREVASVLEVMPESSNRLLMQGVLASRKGIFEGLPNNRPNRYPEEKNIAGIFVNDPCALCLIHYHTDEPETLFNQMRVITDHAMVHFQGFQLNVSWPPAIAMERYRRDYPEMQIVLQIGSEALRRVRNSPEKLVRKVMNEYAGSADYILLDASSGHGKPLDAASVRNYLEALRAEGAEEIFGLVVAGGLSAATLHLIEPLVQDFPDISIDAESCLRDKDDHLDIAAAKDYVKKALQMFKG